MHFFGTLEARDAFLRALPHGVSAAKLLATNDSLLAPLPEEDAAETTKRGRYTVSTYAVRHLAAHRAQLSLPPPRLSAAAVASLLDVRAMERDGRADAIPPAIQAFFRTFGTHAPAGPLLAGGLAAVSAGPVSWDATREDHRRAARGHLDCLTARAMSAKGAAIPCGEDASAPNYYGPPADASVPVVSFSTQNPKPQTPNPRP